MQIKFTHHQSAHCENGVVSNLMKHNGFDVSEPMVFGIGSGLLFCYIPFLMVNHAPAITYRAMPGFIFKRFAKRVGIKIKREKFKNPKDAKTRLDENLNNNNPVGLQVGVYNLVYFPDEYRFHFNAHNLVVYGKEGDNYLISDPVMEDVTTLTDKELEKVRFAKGAFAPKGHIYYPTDFPKELALEKAIKKGNISFCGLNCIHGVKCTFVKRSPRGFCYYKKNGSLSFTSCTLYTSKRNKKVKKHNCYCSFGLYFNLFV